MTINSLTTNVSNRIRESLKLIAMGRSTALAGEASFLAKNCIPDDRIALTNCAVFDGIHSEVYKGMTILVEKGHITAVEKQDKIGSPANYYRVDAQGKTVLPGLIDSHVHLCSPFTYQLNLAAIRQMKKQILRNCLKTIDSGITTVCDMGGPWGIIREFRDLASRNEIVAPRTMNCFTLIAPRLGRRLGYPTQVKMFGPLQQWLLEGQVVSRPGSFKELESIIRRVQDCGGRHIKTTCQSQPFSDKKLAVENLLPTFDDDWMKTLLNRSREAHIAVSIHAPYAADAERCVDLAIETGAQIRLQHMVFDVEIKHSLLKKMQDHGVSIIPTVMVYGDAFDLPKFINQFSHDPDNDLTPEARRQLTARIQTAIEKERLSGRQVLELDTSYFRKQFSIVCRNTQMAHEAGVIGLGTDCGGTYTGVFGRIYSEVQHYAALGIRPLDILKYLTSVNAGINGLDNRGTIRPGKLADLTIFDGEPLTDLAALTRVCSVMKGGTFLKVDSIEFSSPLP